MKRREFIAGLGGAAAVGARGAWGQQNGRVRRIGVLLGVAEGTPNIWLTTFEQELARLGWTQGRNAQIEVRWSGGDANKVRAYMAELVALKPDVILASGTLAVSAVQKETRTIPVIGVLVIDMVASGFAKSLAHPGGNITGFSNFETAIGGKWLLTLKEVAPNIERVAVMLNPDNRAHAGIAQTIEVASQSLGLRSTRLPVHSTEDIAQRIAEIAGQANSLVVLPDTVTISHSNLIIALAAKHQVPAVYPYRQYGAAGGLMSYGPDQNDFYRRAASYADRILRGESPADLPIQTPTKFELVFNLKAAKALGLSVPEAFLVRADEVIE
jgi:putative ABC transport system substrate-binding protein